jgi:hypothetical protein
MRIPSSPNRPELLDYVAAVFALVLLAMVVWGVFNPFYAQGAPTNTVTSAVRPVLVNTSTWSFVGAATNTEFFASNDIARASHLSAVSNTAGSAAADLATVSNDLDTAEANLATVSNDLDTAESNLATVSNDLDTAESNLATVSNDLDTAEANLTTVSNTAAGAIQADGSVPPTCPIGWGEQDLTNVEKVVFSDTGDGAYMGMGNNPVGPKLLTIGTTPNLADIADGSWITISRTNSAAGGDLLLGVPPGSDFIFYEGGVPTTLKISAAGIDGGGTERLTDFKLDASDLDTNTVPLARLSGITSDQIATATDTAYRNSTPNHTPTVISVVNGTATVSQADGAFCQLTITQANVVVAIDTDYTTADTVVFSLDILQYAAASNITAYTNGAGGLIDGESWEALTSLESPPATNSFIWNKPSSSTIFSVRE